MKCIKLMLFSWHQPVFIIYYCTTNYSKTWWLFKAANIYFLTVSVVRNPQVELSWVFQLRVSHKSTVKALPGAPVTWSLYRRLIYCQFHACDYWHEVGSSGAVGLKNSFLCWCWLEAAFSSLLQGPLQPGSWLYHSRVSKRENKGDNTSSKMKSQSFVTSLGSDTHHFCHRLCVKNELLGSDHAQ